MHIQLSSVTASKENVMACGLTARPANGVRNLTATVIPLWFLLALSGSLLGVFDSEPRPPILLGLAAVVPIAVYGFLYLTSGSFGTSCCPSTCGY
jgi:hypothetical protein